MSSPSLSIVALGDWSAERLFASSRPSNLRLNPTLSAAIERVWQEALSRQGVHLFDGPLCRLEDLRIDERGLHLGMSPTSYRIFMGTNGRHPQWADEFGRQVMADPIGTSVALRSADGVLVFGRRSARVALYPGHAHPFGGTMEPPTEGSTVDILEEMRRELREEAGITTDDLIDLRVIAVIEDRHLRQPELVYAAECRLPVADIISRIDAEEHSGSWLLADERGAIEQALGNGQKITPVLAGTLLAWGWRRFGDSWLNAHLAACQAERQPVARWG